MEDCDGLLALRNLTEGCAENQACLAAIDSEQQWMANRAGDRRIQMYGVHHDERYRVRDNADVTPLPPFAGALDADVGSIMCSYNKINGQGDPTPRGGAKSGFKPGHWSCENPVTLKGDLKGIWRGFR